MVQCRLICLLPEADKEKKTDGNDADSKSSDPNDGPPENKPRAQTFVIKSK